MDRQERLVLLEIQEILDPKVLRDQMGLRASKELLGLMVSQELPVSQGQRVLSEVLEMQELRDKRVR